LFGFLHDQFENSPPIGAETTSEELTSIKKNKETKKLAKTTKYNQNLEP